MILNRTDGSLGSEASEMKMTEESLVPEVPPVAPAGPAAQACTKTPAGGARRPSNGNAW